MPSFENKSQDLKIGGFKFENLLFGFAEQFNN